MKSNQQIGFGAVLSYIQIAVGAIITILYTPFLIRVLGQSEYGLYNTVSSVVSSLSILSLGFGSSYIRFYIRYKMAQEEKSIAKLNGIFLIIFSGIGVVALLCGIFLSYHLDWVFANGLTMMELATAKILMLLLTINLAISFPSSVFASIITANEQFIFQKLLLLIQQIVSPLICIPILLMGYASVGMVVSIVAIYLLVDFFNIYFCLRKLQTKFIFASLNWAVLKEVTVFSAFIAVNMIVDQINLNIDKLLLGRFCGTASVAVYSAGYTLYHYYVTFSISISNVFAPHIHQIWNRFDLSEQERNHRLSSIFTYVGRIQFGVLFLVCSGLVLFGRQFIRIWAGLNYANAYWVVVLLAVSAIVPLSQNVGIELQRAKNKHQFRSILYLIMAIINLILSIYLCQRYAEIGSAIGTAISFIVANGVLMNVYYVKGLDIDIFPYWKACARIVRAACVPLLVGIFLCQYLNTWNLGSMLISIIIYSLTYIACIYLFALNTSERKKLLNIFLCLIKRKIY